MTQNSWSVGAWAGATQLIGNGEVISIEVCNDGGPFSKTEINYLRDLVLYIMDDEDIPASRVVRHYDCHSGHKRCPEYYCGSEAADKRWKELWEYITNPPAPEWYEMCVWNSHGKLNQKWILNDKGNGIFEIESVAHRGFVLDVKGEGTGKGTPVILYKRNGGKNQLWRIKEEGIHSYIEPAYLDGMRLDVTGAVCVPGTRMEIWDANDSVAQKFIIMPDRKGECQILNDHPDTKLMLDVVGG